MLKFKHNSEYRNSIFYLFIIYLFNYYKQYNVKIDVIFQIVTILFSISVFAASVAQSVLLLKTFKFRIHLS